MTDEITQFPDEVIEKLQYYVYRLIDPRSGETFYVGKGKGNRVFAHVRGQVGEGGDDESDKLKIIRDIRGENFEVQHVIHRHGMNQATAFEVEAALMQAYPRVANIVSGHDSSRGVMHVRQIVREYTAAQAEFKHRALLISVNETYAEQTSYYRATQYAWKVSLPKAKQAEVVLATVHGLIVAAFDKLSWAPATAENFPGRETIPGRFGFHGDEASSEIRDLYVGKRVPDSFKKPGAANPVRYTWP